MTRVLTGNQINVAQNSQGPLRDVFQISDWGRDDVERAGHVSVFFDIYDAGRARVVGTHASGVLARGLN